MHRLDRLTATLLLVAGLGSLALMLSAFVDHIPVRDGSKNLVRAASGGYAEVQCRTSDLLREVRGF
jgi:hypothetical protein